MQHVRTMWSQPETISDIEWPSQGIAPPGPRIHVLTLSPRSMNLIATCCRVTRSYANCTNPNVPRFRSSNCKGRSRAPIEVRADL